VVDDRALLNVVNFDASKVWLLAVLDLIGLTLRTHDDQPFSIGGKTQIGNTVSGLECSNATAATQIEQRHVPITTTKSASHRKVLTAGMNRERFHQPFARFTRMCFVQLLGRRVLPCPLLPKLATVSSHRITHVAHAAKKQR